MDHFIIRDDPTRNDGGWALILLPAGRVATGQVALSFTDISGERPVVTAQGQARETADGIEVTVGDGQLDSLDPGRPIEVAVAGDVVGQLPWPALSRRPATARTPFRRPTRPVAVQTNPQPAGTDGPAAAKPGTMAITDPEQPGSHKPTVVPPPEEDAKAATAEAVTVTGQVQDGQQLAKPTPPPPRLWWLIAGAVAAGLVIGVFAGHRLWPKEADMPALPSVYSMLDQLPTRSPAGVLVASHNVSDFLARMSTADNVAERSFWTKWAVRSLVEPQSADHLVAQGVFPLILSELAFEFANAGQSPGNRLAAKFLWEFGALGGNCKMMDNIAQTAGQLGVAQEAEIWRTRFIICQKTSGGR